MREVIFRILSLVLGVAGLYVGYIAYSRGEFGGNGGYYVIAFYLYGMSPFIAYGLGGTKILSKIPPRMISQNLK
ncbi:hypothetical protein [Paraglaciecola psychrophila]|uniref:Uncharacterized protein n=1 Tax=Paraglaciecola psychrophila 170 TaxID=1129794 RepID=K7AE92_9ALTE|nr:hypothetical protein [Paraglaciecola psychrophila]AGH42730.1 hypothetical protein C427_0620 [Paraglaciecola psychrophila 170]GAC38963.1 hypothetical protein GPSY_3352 [Paraglaciecola psychrophila 170]